MGKQRLGIKLISLIAELQEAGRLPFRVIRWYLDTVHGLRLSVGAIVAATQRVAQMAQGVMADVRERIRGSPVVHADETGWREDGHNGYVWTFSAPAARYFLRRGRGKAVVDEALGDEFVGVLVSDFYAAYHHYDGPKQRCRAHPGSSPGQALLRDIHDLRALYPDDRRRRVEKHIKSRPRTGYGELFVFVAQPEAPSDNNAAERSLRHLAVSRKVSGGTRSQRGTDTKMTLASVFGAWRAQGLNTLTTCRQLLASPQV